MKKLSRWKLVPVLAGLISLGLIAAGCGSDDGSGSDGESSSPPLTKQEYISEADAICAEGDAEITAALEEQFPTGLSEQPSIEEQREFISTTVADGFESQLDQLRELNPPEADAEQVNAILDELDALVDTARNDPDALISGDAGGNQAGQLAQDYGFTDCGS